MLGLIIVSLLSVGALTTFIIEELDDDDDNPSTPTPPGDDDPDLDADLLGGDGDDLITGTNGSDLIEGNGGDAGESRLKFDSVRELDSGGFIR